MGRTKKPEKEYKLNVDTISLNLEQSCGALGLFPYSEEIYRQEDPWWMAPTDPRKLRRKGTSVGSLDTKLDDKKYSNKK